MNFKSIIQYILSIYFVKKIYRNFLIFITTFKFKKTIILKSYENYKLILNLKEYTAWSYYFKSYEKNITNFIRNNLKKDSNVVDVGANLGFYSILFATIASKGKIYAFEPEKKNFKKILKNIKINNLKNIKVYNIGLSSFKSNRKLILTNKINDGGHFIETNSNFKKYNYQTIKTDKLDNIITKKKKFEIIKIDVEGHELEVLKGMKEILKKTKFIIIETGNQYYEINLFLIKNKFKTIHRFKKDTIFKNTF